MPYESSTDQTILYLCQYTSQSVTGFSFHILTKAGSVSQQRLVWSHSMKRELRTGERGAASLSSVSLSCPLFTDRPALESMTELHKPEAQAEHRMHQEGTKHMQLPSQWETHHLLAEKLSQRWTGSRACGCPASQSLKSQSLCGHWLERPVVLSGGTQKTGLLEHPGALRTEHSTLEHQTRKN